MTERIIRLEVFRYRPETDTAPGWDTYVVPCQPEWVVLDALNYIKDHLDGTLSYRWSCHMAVCGSCGMMVNGKPVLSCKAFVRDYPDHIRVAPLENLDVTRDLVVRQDRLMESLGEVKSWLIPGHSAGNDATFRQTPAELARYRHLSMCINCMLCYAACPQVGLNPGYLGPAALALAQRYNLDSRDGGARERMESTASDDGVWECTFVGECSEVCPKHVDPAGAIQQMKLAASLDWFVRLLPGGVTMKPQPWHPTLTAGWWLKTAGYRRYMLRELTSAPIGLFAAVLTLGLVRLGQGPLAWDGFRSALASPAGVLMLTVILAASIYHSLSWFMLAPSTMPIYFGARKVSPAWIAGGHFLAWLAISLGIVLAAGG